MTGSTTSTPVVPNPGYRLVESHVLPLTKTFAEEFRALEASPTERELNEARVKHLREKADSGQLITFQWAKARFQDRILRMNGQHSSAMLCSLDGAFPEGLKVHLDTYEVDSSEALALLFRQFDDRKSGRTPYDVSGAYQHLFPALKDVPPDTAKRAVEGVSWYRAHIDPGVTVLGDEQYRLFNQTALHDFIIWTGQLFSIKTPELKRTPVIAAIYGTFVKNETEARTFWTEVGRGGAGFDDNAPTTMLDTWLKAMSEDRLSRKSVKPMSFYNGCIYAWNAFRDGRANITSIKHEHKKGPLDIKA
jgi:hypothetical protein